MSVASPSVLRRRFIGMLAAAAAATWMPTPVFADAYVDFFRAVKIDDDGKVRSLLARGLDPNIVEHERGNTGLILALQEDSMNVFDALLDARGIDLDAKAFNGNNALMIACFKGNKRAVQALLEKGAQVNRPGWTPLHYAAASGNNDIVRMLIERAAYIDAESPNKTTPLMMAARAGHILTVKLLLDEGADATLKNELGMTAIDFAEKHNHKDIAEGLTSRLKKAGKL